jgi:hypothetical protein
MGIRVRILQWKLRSGYYNGNKDQDIIMGVGARDIIMGIRARIL